MIIRSQQFLFDLILFLYGLVAIIFASRMLWITKRKLNEVFQFFLAAIVVWTIVKFVSILTDLRLISIYAVGLGELFFITLLIVGAWYAKHTLLETKRNKPKRRKR